MVVAICSLCSFFLTLFNDRVDQLIRCSPVIYLQSLLSIQMTVNTGVSAKGPKYEGTKHGNCSLQGKSRWEAAMCTSKEFSLFFFSQSPGWCYKGLVHISPSRWKPLASAAFSVYKAALFDFPVLLMFAGLWLGLMRGAMCWGWFFLFFSFFFSFAVLFVLYQRSWVGVKQ